MKSMHSRVDFLCLMLVLALASLSLSGCSPDREGLAPLSQSPDEAMALDASRYLVAVEDESDTVDFQCTTIYYTIATNVFNRLVEMENTGDGSVAVVPSLARSWEVSDDGRSYTFHLRENVTFSNGSPLTASDVRYTFTRLLTHPNSCNRDIAEGIVGARRLERGEADCLEGFEVLGDLDFTVTLEQPFEAFLACLSMPGASILDAETTEAAGDRFGRDPECTVGTGSFVLKTWEPGKGMTLAANTSCWQGAPRCAGLDLCFLTEPEEIQTMFEGGQLDILDLDDVGSYAEFFLHGDIYQGRIYQVPRIGTTYIALNESIAPLNSVLVRRALQLALNREMLLNVVYSGLGSVENGIFPHGLYGFNPELPAIPYDPGEARALLSDAGYSDGFDLTVSVKSTSTQWEMTLMRLAVSMWAKVGVRATIEVLDEGEFMRRRKSGSLACYTAMWTADFDDPDNFIYTFFGNQENTAFRSLCYPNEAIMERVRGARVISDPEARLAEYRDLERIIIQEDAAWIPLFSRLRSYVMSERITGVQSSWNGSVKNKYREIAIKAPEEG